MDSRTEQLAPDRQGVDPRTAATWRTVRTLLGAYVAISALTVIAIVLMRSDTGIVNAAVWIRGCIVALASLLTYSFAVRASRGSQPAYRRLRIVSAAMVVAVVVIVSLPGTFPVWMKIEQGVCGLLLATVVAVVNGARVRASFPTN